MITLFFCLDCEDNFQVTDHEEVCPFCASKNIMEDLDYKVYNKDDDDKPDWDDGHYEGDMTHRAPMTDMGDD